MDQIAKKITTHSHDAMTDEGCHDVIGITVLMTLGFNSQIELRKDSVREPAAETDGHLEDVL